MDDQSLWKKELSFGRKSKGKKDGDESQPSDEKPTSMWKKELSFKRKPKAEGVEGDVAADTPVSEEPVMEEPVAEELIIEQPPAAEPELTEEPFSKKDVSFSERISSYGRSAEAEPVVADETAPLEDLSDLVPEPAAEEKVWKKEVSFSRKPEAEPVAEELVAALEDVSDLVPEPAAEEEAWKKEVSFSRKPEAEPVAEEPFATLEDLGDLVPEPAAEEKAWKKEVSFSRKPEAEPVVREPVAAPEDLADLVPEPAAEEKAWKKEVSFSRKPEAEPVAEQQPSDDPPVAEEEPVATDQVIAEEPVAIEEPVAEEPVVAETLASVDVAAEPWNAPPSLPPAPIDEASTAAVPVPTPSLDVQPPVAAADLPPLVDDVAKVPFWKKELSFGGKKRDKPDEASAAAVPVPTPSVDVQPPVAAADLPPLADDVAKVPFWKKELSLGGKKRDKPVKERKQKVPKVKAERAPKTKDPKPPKEAKQRKQKTPKVKAEGGSTKGRIIGLKIGASQLAAARVSNNGSAELLQVAREPLAAGIVVGGELRDPDALAEALKDFFAKHGLPKKGVRLGIANNRIGVRTFEIAGIEDQKQLANAIRFRAQETLPIPIDEAVLDYQVLGEGVDEDGQSTKRVLLVVAYRELIDRYVDACKKAGITLAGIDLEAFALLRALQAPQEGVGTDATAALVVVAIGHERSTFAVSDGRVCEFTRVLEWGGSALNVAIARAVDAAQSEVEGMKRALALTDEMVPDGLTSEQAKDAREAMRRAIQTFARELVSSLQYYQNQPGSLGIGEIVLTGGTAHLPGISGELERLIGVHVRVGDPLARMKVSKKVGQPEQIGSLAVAIGLGIED
jgi:type IV pilus assembly protein PilM